MVAPSLVSRTSSYCWVVLSPALCIFSRASRTISVLPWAIVHLAGVARPAVRGFEHHAFRPGDASGGFAHAADDDVSATGADLEGLRAFDQSTSYFHRSPHAAFLPFLFAPCSIVFFIRTIRLSA